MLVAELQAVISERARLIESLAAQHTELSARANAARLVLAHVEALQTTMAMALGADAGADGAAGTEGELSGLLQDLRADGGAAPPPVCGVALNWSPDRAAALLSSSLEELTLDGLQRKLRGLVSLAGCLLP